MIIIRYWIKCIDKEGDEYFISFLVNTLNTEKMTPSTYTIEGIFTI